MARLLKSGIDYFPLDVTLNSNFELIVARYHSDGFTVLIRLFQYIYGGNGYYCDWNEETGTLFAYKNGLDIIKTQEIVAEAVRRSIFDEGLYDSYGVLTSRGIQYRYFEIVKRRKRLSVRGELILIDINYKDADNNDENVNIIKQSKVEESKVKQKRVDKSRVDLPTQLLQKEDAQELPSLQQVKDYCKNRRSMVDPNRFYDYFTEGGWRDSNGRVVKNWKQKLIAWERDSGTRMDKPPDVLEQKCRVPPFKAKQ